MSEDIPVIDIARLEEPRTLRAIDEACRTWGFFHVTRHGIAENVLSDLFAAAHAFFARPTTEKRSILRSAENPWGYYDQELTKNTRDWKEVFDFGPADPARSLVPRWPHALPRFEPAIRNYFAACEDLSRRLVGAIALNLGTRPADLLRGFGAEHTSFVRLNHYPACPTPSAPDGLSAPVGGYLGISHHTDAGAITVLVQDEQPGLETFRDGRWHLVRPRDDAFVVNIGDIVQVWSNDRYRAALHRVIVNSEKERFSAPFFFNPSYDTDYAPLPALIDGAHPARYRPINWGEFRALRHAGDYADVGEEVQLAHYAL
jgi:isopenicillin N synthase-like dioxygenase